GSLRLIGSLGIGRGITSDGSIAGDCLFALNSLLSTWNTERLSIHRIAVDTYTLTGAASYTLGPGGNFDAPVPVRIESAVLVNGESRTPLELLTRERWMRRHAGLYVDPGVVLLTLYLEPAATGQLELHSWEPLEEIADVDDTLVLPQGYTRALMYNLAIELAPQFPDATLSPLVIEQAKESKAAIQRLNVPVLELACDDALVSRGCFDILTGDFA
ncbi:MAG: hypothetical protein ACRELT_10100, partial [Longimicrobiales bacterium]